jgi:tryptophan halogenase
MGQKSNSSKMKICIIGGGTTGWWSAGWLEHKFPDYEITLIESDTIPKIGVGESTLPQIGQFFRDLGINEKDWMEQSNAVYKYGNIKQGWDHPDAEEMRFMFWVEDIKSIDNWFQKYFSDSIKKDNINETFWKPGKPYSIAYHLDAERAADVVKNNCKRVKHLVQTLDSLPEGYDLYLDCTGLRRQFVKDTTEIEFEHHLVDRAWVCPYYHNGSYDNYTKSTARPYGWQFKIDLTNRLGTGYVFSSKYVSEEQALKDFKEYNKELRPYNNKEPRLLKWKPSVLKNPWSDNVVAIGLSSGFLDPLEANALYMNLYGVQTLARCLEKGLGAKTYNRLVNRTWRQNSDYITTHYALSNRDDTEFWKYYKNIDAKQMIWDLFKRNQNEFHVLYGNSIYATLALYYDEFEKYERP